MTSLPTADPKADDRPPAERSALEPPVMVGLRERKKARTRASIQDHALRLFRQRGYDATTIEQIAEAAEVSPSTFFRYFPTKEEVVMYDVFDPLLIEIFRAQPIELAPLTALRRAMKQVFADLPASEFQKQIEREDLIRSVPELRIRMLQEFMRTLELLISLLAERTGRPTTDMAVRSLAGAVIGVSFAAWLTSQTHRLDSYLTEIDAGLAQLEAGLPF
jgi:AcrR family transcriptional regulator